MSETPGSIVFDHHGALELARSLHHLADRWDGTFGDRTTALALALAAWTGPAREEVARRAVYEGDASRRATDALRAEADRWAVAWAQAVDDGIRLAWDAATGPGSTPFSLPPPGPVPVPTAPDFAPTAVPLGSEPVGIRR